MLFAKRVLQQRKTNHKITKELNISAYHIRLMPRISRAMLSLPNTPSWSAQGKPSLSLGLSLCVLAYSIVLTVYQVL